MARTKKVEEEIKEVKTTEENTTKKSTVKKETVDLQSQLDKSQAENEAMRKQLEEMQKMMLQLQQTVLTQQTVNAQQQNNSISDNDSVEIVSYAWGRLGLTDKDNTVVLDFRDSYEVEKIPYRQFLDIATTKNKNEFFKKGLVALVGDSKKYYNNIGVVEPYVLSKENIIKIYELPYNEAIKKIESLISKKEDRVWTTIYYQTLRMLAKEEINDAKVLNTINIVLTQYFGVRSIQTAIGMVNLAKDINFVH